MSYIPPYALDNLKKYAYKGVDKQVHSLPAWLNGVLTDPKVFALEIRLEPVLDMAGNPLAEMGCP